MNMMIVERAKIPSYFVLANFILYGCFMVSVLTDIWMIAFFGAFFGAFLITQLYTESSFIISSVLMVLCLQNFVIGLFGKIASNYGSLSIMTQVPFIFLAFIFLFMFFERRIKPNITFLYIFFLLIFIVISFLNKGGSIQGTIVQVRNLIVYFLAFEIFINCIKKENDFFGFSRQFIIIGIFMTIVAVILLIGGFELYTKIGIANVYAAKGNVGEGVYSLPGRFTSDIFGIHVFRMGGLYYEPVTLSYFFSAEFIGAITLPWTNNAFNRFFVTVLFGFSLLLTGGKGGMLITFALLLALVFLKTFFKNVSPLKIWGVLIGIIIFMIFFSLFYSQHFAGPAAAHFITIENTWKNIISEPMGHGLAQGGFNIVDSGFSYNDKLSTGAESALMSIGYQLGLPGMIILAVIFISITRRVMNSRKEKGLLNNSYNIVISCIPVVLYGISIFQLNTFTPQAIIPFMALMSGAMVLDNNYRVDNV